MLEESIPLSPEKYSHVLRKLIDAISQAPMGSEGLKKIFQETLNSLEETIGVERASILLFDPDGVMRFKAWLGISDKYRKTVEGHTPWTPEDINPPALITPDIYEDKTLTPYFATFEAEDIRSLAFIPLLYRSKVVGKFMIYSRVPYQFTKEIEPASTIAQLVAYAVVRKKNEEQIALSETRFKAIVENEPECVNIINQNGIIQEMNPAGLEIFSVASLDKIIGKSIIPLIEKRYQQPFKEFIKRVCQGEKSSMEFELTNHLFLETHAVPLYSEENDNTMMLAITRDITDKKRREAEREHLLIKEKEARLGAEKSLQLRDDFLSIASHELKTPLTPILLNFQLVDRYLRSVAADIPKAALLMKVFENTDQQFDRFLKLVENLLDVSRISADRLVLEKESLDLSHLLQDIVKRFKSEFKNAGCTVNLKIEEKIIGFWDRVRIEQVIVNLITNAMKYGLQRPIDISLTRGNNTVQLIVHDHGIGIAKKDQEKIFSRFERVASTTHFGGLGLGLYITNNIILAHEGSIRVESKLGSGSAFIVELPINLM